VLHGQDAQQAAVRFTQQVYFLLVKAITQVLGQLGGVGDGAVGWDVLSAVATFGA